MLESGRDAAPVYASGDTPDKVKYLPAIQILDDRAAFSASLGVTPAWSRKFVRRIPWFARGSQAVANLAGVRYTWRTRVNSKVSFDLSILFDVDCCDRCGETSSGTQRPN
jgi:hypothetical protein